MSKKSKLISTFCLFLVMIIAIPVAVMAFAQSKGGINNNVSFLIRDIVGDFAYEIEGNENTDKDGNFLQRDVAYESANIFTGEYIAELDDPNDLTSNPYVITPAAGLTNNNGVITVNHPNGLKFKEFNLQDKPTITYYFTFINRGDADVVVKAEYGDGIKQNLAAHSVSTAWSYYEDGFTTSSTLNSVPVKDFGSIGVVEGDPNYMLDQGVIVEKVATSAGANNYHYVVLRFDMVLQSYENNDENTTCDLDLTITLEAVEE